MVYNGLLTVREGKRNAMPLYEYKCSKCGATVETLQGVHDAPLRKCRECGGKLVKLISAPAIQFKGNGWYITDYAKKHSPVQADTPAAKPDPGKPKEPAKPPCSASK